MVWTDDYNSDQANIVAGDDPGVVVGPSYHANGYYNPVSQKGVFAFAEIIQEQIIDILTVF